MMPKDNVKFRCQACGYITTKWMGRCPDCGTWNSITEEPSIKEHTRVIQDTEPIPLSDVSFSEDTRVSTGIKELDRVLGGGVVAGSVVLIGGDPGVGKSTLLLQTMAGLLKDISTVGLYISAEESAQQVKLRSNRLGIDIRNILVLPETRIEKILHYMDRIKPALVVVDSIQTIYTETLSSAPGTVAQVRECSAKLTVAAKRYNIPLFIIGHVTKEGAIAGPRVLEHIVDTVLYFEGDKSQAFRILRAVKNRFGSTNEIGVFEMTDSGLKEVKNPSELFLSGQETAAPGTVLTATLEGTRSIIIEIQALVSPTTFGMPRRTSIGVDVHRSNLLIAVLEKIGGLQLGLSDIYVNVIGGLRVFEPAVDLAVATAIATSFRNTAIDRETIFIGEIGLSGEVRAVSQIETRLKEAEKIGLKKAIIPQANLNSRISTTMQLWGVKNVKEVLEMTR
jgi:DNA repair protein RadA/Sms